MAMHLPAIALPTEPNHRRSAIIGRSVLSTGVLGSTAAVVMANVAQLQVGGTACVAIAAWIGVTGLITSAMMGIVLGRPAPRMDAHLRGSYHRVASRMLEACGSGIEDPDRAGIQADIELMRRSLVLAVGPDLWRIRAESGNNLAIPATIGEKAVLLRRLMGLTKVMNDPNGGSRSSIRGSMVNAMPIVASIAEDFGFDVEGLVPPTSPLPGMIRSSVPTPRTDDGVPTSELRSLADRWIEGDRERVDVLVRIEADAAAGRDLRQLEEAWTAARRASPEDAAEIDARYEAGAARLRAVLQNAIDARARTARDQLDIRVRYVETKHLV